jgi:hypothetical protein
MAGFFCFLLPTKITIPILPTKITATKAKKLEDFRDYHFTAEVVLIVSLLPCLLAKQQLVVLVAAYCSSCRRVLTDVAEAFE